MSKMSREEREARRLRRAERSARAVALAAETTWLADFAAKHGLNVLTPKNDDSAQRRAKIKRARRRQVRQAQAAAGGWQ